MPAIGRLVVALTVTFALSSPAQAVIINASGNDGGVGIIQVTPNGFEASVFKIYTGLGAMAVTLEVDEVGFYGFTDETIVNLTPNVWSDFTWLLVADPSVLFFDLSDPAPFLSTTVLPTAASVSGGGLAIGGVMTPTIQVMVTQVPIGGTVSFSIIQVPTPARPAPAAPEPGTLALLGVALLGLGLARRVRRAF